MAATWALQASGIYSGKKGRNSTEGGVALPKPIRCMCARASLMHACGSIGVETLRVMGLSPKAACRHEQTNGVR